MTNDTDFYSSDRLQVIQDERDRIITLSDFNLQLPQVGIFDSPVRCYTVNKEWAKIITGGVSLLLEIACWPDAENEDYAGIRAILEFLQGGDCMDCNGVEACLVNSPIILALQNQVNINKNDIIAHQALINNLTDYVADHESRIGLIEGDIVDIQLSILGLNVITDDHETRITSLENSGVGGNAPQFKVTPLKAFINANDDNTSINWKQASDSIVSHTFTYDNVFILVEFRGVSVSGLGEFRFALENQAASTFTELVSVQVQSLQCQQIYSDLAGQTLELSIEHHIAGGTLSRLVASQFVQYTVFEWDTTSNVYGSPHLVTFDPGGDAYTLPNANDGIVSSGGNPMNCLFGQSLVLGDSLWVQIPFAQPVQINAVSVDIFAIHPTDGDLLIRVRNGVTVTSIDYKGDIPTGDGVWETYSSDVDYTGVIGDIVEVRIEILSATMQDARLDNIKIEFTEL